MREQVPSDYEGPYNDYDSEPEQESRLWGEYQDDERIYENEHHLEN